MRGPAKPIACTNAFVLILILRLASYGLPSPSAAIQVPTLS